MSSNHTYDKSQLDQGSGPSPKVREHTQNYRNDYWRCQVVDQVSSVSKLALLEPQDLGTEFIRIDILRIRNHLEKDEKVVQITNVPCLPQIKLLKLLDNLLYDTGLF